MDKFVELAYKKKTVIDNAAFVKIHVRALYVGWDFRVISDVPASERIICLTASSKEPDPRTFPSFKFRELTIILSQVNVLIRFMN